MPGSSAQNILGMNSSYLLVSDRGGHLRTDEVSLIVINCPDLFSVELCFFWVKGWWVVFLSLCLCTLLNISNIYFWHIKAVNLDLFSSLYIWLYGVYVCAHSCCWWSVSCRRCILCSRCVGRSWRTGRETLYRRNLSGSFSWCCRSRITWMPDRSARPHLFVSLARWDAQQGQIRVSTKFSVNRKQQFEKLVLIINHLNMPFYRLYSKHTTTFIIQ